MSYKNEFCTKDILLFKSDRNIILKFFVEHFFIHFQITQLGISHEDTMY